MLERQRLARNGPASALLLATVFLTLSLLYYDPADPPGCAAEPPNAPPRNPCGPVGAALAHLLFTTFGWSSFLLSLGLAAADVLWFRRRAVPEVRSRLAGFALVVAVAAALVQKMAPELSPSPPVGSGGYVGALAVAFFEGQFGWAGMLLILTSAGLLGLWLCGEVLFL
ncbi:MAG TPA: DNA translocase FtsK 4TM domain-containing protein, partial [Isosphaeraceae bacterium]|nr:DNA translocase FtsK 4TM domain-containing protein [Isosphaeraceae bacterium]